MVTKLLHLSQLLTALSGYITALCTHESKDVKIEYAIR